MKQQLFKLALVTAIIFLCIAACKKDPIEADKAFPPQQQLPNPLPVNALIKQIKYSENEHQEFSYNAQHQVAQYRNQYQYVEGDPTQLRSISYDFQYDAQHRPIRVNHTGGFVTKYFYRNNLIERTQEFSPRGAVLNDVTYRYDGTRIVEEHHTQSNVPGQPASLYKYVFSYDAKGNLNQIKAYTQRENLDYELFETTEYSDFDDKVNPASWTLRFPFLPQVRWQYNNPGKEVLTPVNGTARTFVYHYNYNTQDLPVSKRKTSAGGSAVGQCRY